MSARCAVTAFEANVDAPEADFEPVFPIGARVIDITSGKEMHSAVLPSGERGKEMPYVPGKSMPTHEELMAQPPQRGLWERLWPWVLLAVGFLLITGGAVWRLRRGAVRQA